MKVKGKIGGSRKLSPGCYTSGDLLLISNFYFKNTLGQLKNKKCFILFNKRVFFIVSKKLI